MLIKGIAGFFSIEPPPAIRAEQVYLNLDKLVYVGEVW